MKVQTPSEKCMVLVSPKNSQIARTHCPPKLGFLSFYCLSRGFKPGHCRLRRKNFTLPVCLHCLASLEPSRCFNFLFRKNKLVSCKFQVFIIHKSSFNFIVCIHCRRTQPYLHGYIGTIPTQSHQFQLSKLLYLMQKVLCTAQLKSKVHFQILCFSA